MHGIDSYQMKKKPNTTITKKLAQQQKCNTKKNPEQAHIKTKRLIS